MPAGRQPKLTKKLFINKDLRGQVLLHAILKMRGGNRCLLGDPKEHGKEGGKYQSKETCIDVKLALELDVCHILGLIDSTTQEQKVKDFDY